jgi:hypothetical protein
MDKEQRAMAKIIAECWADPRYKARFVADPARVMRAAGIAVPAGSRVRVYQSGESVRHIVLPPAPPGSHAARSKAEDRVPAYTWYTLSVAARKAMKKSTAKKAKKKGAKKGGKKAAKKGGAKKKRGGKRKPK